MASRVTALADQRKQTPGRTELTPPVRVQLLPPIVCVLHHLPLPFSPALEREANRRITFPKVAFSSATRGPIDAFADRVGRECVPIPGYASLC